MLARHNQSALRASLVPNHVLGGISDNSAFNEGTPTCDVQPPLFFQLLYDFLPLHYMQHGYFDLDLPLSDGPIFFLIRIIVLFDIEFWRFLGWMRYLVELCIQLARKVT